AKTRHTPNWAVIGALLILVPTEAVAFDVGGALQGPFAILEVTAGCPNTVRSRDCFRIPPSATARYRNVQVAVGWCQIIPWGSTTGDIEWEAWVDCGALIPVSKGGPRVAQRLPPVEYDQPYNGDLHVVDELDATAIRT